ncbi:MAG: cupin domain-containing protein [Acidimicrobiia bacterium]
MALFGLMVVRNAHDLLGVNVRHHLAQGVERFLVYDHASTDTTREVLCEFADQGVLEWSAVDGPFRSEEWLNELAIEAYIQGADWVLPIDADEFWTAGPGRTMAECVAASDAGALRAQMLTFVQQHDQLESTPKGLLRMVYRMDGLSREQLAENERRLKDGAPIPFWAAAYDPKCLSRATPALHIHRGSHYVSGVTGPIDPTVEIVCMHAPVRSRAALADRHQPWPPLDPSRRPGHSWHLQRLKRVGPDPESIDREWALVSAVDDRIVSSDVRLVHDTRLRDAVAPWIDDTGRITGPLPAVASPERRTRGREEALSAALRHTRQRVVDLDRRLGELEAAQAADADRWALEAAAQRDDFEARERQLSGALAEKDAELDYWRDVESGKAYRLWRASIRLRRAMGVVRDGRGSQVPGRSDGSPDSDLRVDVRSIGAAVHDRGFSESVRLFAPDECRRLLSVLRDDPPEIHDWDKDGAASSRPLYEMAMHPAVVEVVRHALGPDVVLWGASMAERPPGAVHPWHSDFESVQADDGTLSVWIGLENSSAGRALRFVPRSHRFRTSLQQAAREHGVGRGDATDRDVEAWAREHGSPAPIAVSSVREGEAVFFDGRIWHGTVNDTDVPRTAVLFQYARADRPIRIPDLTQLEWPYRLLEEPRPACLPATPGGVAHTEANRVVGPPPRRDGEAPPLAPKAQSLGLPASTDPWTGWKAYHQFNGSTPNLGNLSVHYSVLGPGRCPHPPHEHDDEEILVVLDGECEIVRVDGAGDESVRAARRGFMSYYPTGALHTLRADPDTDVTYLMFKWTGRSGHATDALQADVVCYDDALAEPAGGGPLGFVPELLFEGPTRYLEKLHCHTTLLGPGAGYDAHRDDHDVAILLLEGTIEVLGQRLGDNSIVFVPAGQLHGMHNPGPGVARYLVIEFHGRAPHSVDRTGFEFLEVSPTP